MRMLMNSWGPYSSAVRIGLGSGFRMKEIRDIMKGSLMALGSSKGLHGRQKGMSTCFSFFFFGLLFFGRCISYFKGFFGKSYFKGFVDRISYF